MHRLCRELPSEGRTLPDLGLRRTVINHTARRLAQGLRRESSPVRPTALVDLAFLTTACHSGPGFRFFALTRPQPAVWWSSSARPRPPRRRNTRTRWRGVGEIRRRIVRGTTPAARPHAGQFGSPPPNVGRIPRSQWLSGSQVRDRLLHTPSHPVALNCPCPSSFTRQRSDPAAPLQRQCFRGTRRHDIAPRVLSHERSLEVHRRSYCWIGCVRGLRGRTADRPMVERSDRPDDRGGRNLSGPCRRGDRRIVPGQRSAFAYGHVWRDPHG
jgi:hypothetical protein